MERPSSRQEIERLRPRLFGIAYRMLGSVQDAEDVVQEAFLRWHQTAPGEIENLDGWLVAVVTRLAIDRLRRRRREHVSYVGPWLPEPVAPERLAPRPDRAVELASDVSMAFLVLLERLAPEERAAFLLRDVFDTSYAEIAGALGKSQATVRQIVHRARERVRADRARFVVASDVAERLFRRFVEALERDDEAALLALFAPAATLTSDGGAKVQAARRVIHGAPRLVRLFRAMETKYGHPFAYRLTVLNGEPTLVQELRGDVFSTTSLETDGQRIVAVYRVMNPEKLGDARQARPGELLAAPW